MNKLSQSKKSTPLKIHFVGVGGVSMSALARLAKSKGYIVTGTDDNDSQIIQELKKCGIKIALSHCPEFVQSADIIVYTVAAKSHLDLVLAKSLPKQIIERAEFLGRIATDYKHTIAISGTHGKTTTTAMLGHIFEVAKLNPTVHIGGLSQNWNSNLRLGSSEYFITEACEFNRSFLKLSPECSCITNIECDHMDTYQDYDDIKTAFVKFVNKTKQYVVYCGDNLQLSKKRSKNYISFGFDSKNRFVAKNLSSDNKGAFCFDCFLDNKFYLRAKLAVCGKHNVLNALACIAICYAYHVPYIYIIEGIQTFIGVERRQTLLSEINGITHYADYAHHPTEIANLFDTINLLPRKGKIVTVFQPHTYSRTLGLMGDFVKVLSKCSTLILLPTYSAREKPIAGGDSTDLFFALPPNTDRIYCSNYPSLKLNLDSLLNAGDICLWVGAGDIYQIAKYYIKEQSNELV